MIRTNTARSMQIPDFQKEVIIPQIYDLKNIKLIQEHGYKESPVNKVAALKKNKIQNVIKQIFNKQKPTAIENTPLHKSLNLKKIENQTVMTQRRRRSHYNVLESIETDRCFMEIDEHMGEMMALA